MAENLDSLQGLLDFLAFLRAEKIAFSLHSRSTEAISVDFAGVGIRYEVDFEVGRMSFSYFKGNEDVQTGDERLKALIREHWSD